MGYYGIKGFSKYRKPNYHHLAAIGNAYHHGYKPRRAIYRRHMANATYKGNKFKTVHNQLKYGKMRLNKTKGAFGQRYYGGHKRYVKGGYRMRRHF